MISQKSQAVGVGELLLQIDLAGGRHDPFLGDVGTELGGDLAAAHDDDAVRDAQAFADLRGRVDHGQAAPGAFGQEAEDLGLGADVDAAARLVEEDDGGVRSPASCR